MFMEIWVIDIKKTPWNNILNVEKSNKRTEDNIKNVFQLLIGYFFFSSQRLRTAKTSIFFR